MKFVERAIWQKSCKCHTSGIVPTPYVECREDIINRRYNISRISAYVIPAVAVNVMGYIDPSFIVGDGIIYGFCVSIQLHYTLRTFRYNIPFFSNKECCAMRSFDIAEKISAGIKTEKQNNHDEGMKLLNAEKNIENIEKHIKK